MVTYILKDNEVLLIDKPSDMLNLNDLISTLQDARQKYGNIKIALCDNGSIVLCDSAWFSPESDKGTDEYLPAKIVIS